MKGKKANGAWAIFGLPALLALLCAAGLFAALLGKGWWPVLSWFGLGVPVLIAGRALLFKGGKTD